MRAVIALAIKDLVILARDRLGLFWVALFPLLMALFFGSIFGSDGDGVSGLKVAFSGTGDSASVAAFRTVLGASEALTIEEIPLDSARTLVGRGKKTAYLHFTDTSDSRFGFFGPGKPSIEIGIDPARKTEAGYLLGMVNQAYFTLLGDQMKNPAALRPSIHEQLSQIDTASDMDDAQRLRIRNLLGHLDEFMASVDTVNAADSNGSAGTNSPFAKPDITMKEVTVTDVAPRSTWEITFPQSMQWSLIGVAAAFAIGIVVERRKGTFLRLCLAPISRFQILAGKGLACFLAAVTATTLLLTFGVLVFGVRVGSLPALAAAVACSAFGFVGIMMFMSVLGKTEQAVAGAGWAILLVMSMTGGGMVPLMFMPPWMFKLGSISAVHWSVLALEGAIWRGFGPADMLLPLTVLTGIGALGFTVGTFILSRSD